MKPSPRLIAASFGAIAIVIGIRAYQFRFDQDAAQGVLSLILDGTLKVGKRGEVMLPSHFQKLSVTQSAYFTKLSHVDVLLFPTWIGKGGNIEGFLISNKVIPPSQFGSEIIGGKPSEPTLGLFSQFDPTWIDPSIPGDGKVFVFVEKTSKEGVYKVSNHES